MQAGDCVWEVGRYHRGRLLDRPPQSIEVVGEGHVGVLYLVTGKYMKTLAKGKRSLESSDLFQI